MAHPARPSTRAARTNGGFDRSASLQNRRRGQEESPEEDESDEEEYVATSTSNSTVVRPSLRSASVTAGNKIVISTRKQASTSASMSTRTQGTVAHPNFVPQDVFEESSEEEDEEDNEEEGYSRNAAVTAPRARQQPPTTQVILDSDPRYVSSAVDQDSHQLWSDTTSTAARRKRVVHDSDEDAEGEEDEEVASPPAQSSRTRALSGRGSTSVASLPPVQVYQTASGRRTQKTQVIESDSSVDELGIGGHKSTRRANSKQARKYAGEGSEEEGSFVDDGDDDDDGGRGRRSRRKKMERLASKRTRFKDTRRSTRGSRAKNGIEDDEDYEERSYNRRDISTETDSEDLHLTDAESQDELLQAALDKDGHGRRLRKRAEVNYSLPAMFGLNPDGTPKEPEASKLKEKAQKKKSGYGAPKRLPFNMSGKQLGSLFGEPPDSSDDDDLATPKRNNLFGLPGALPAGGTAASDWALGSGNPNNLGKLPGTTNLADIDPLLPSTTISFDNVGGLQSHIQQLKEMVSLPLLYPEVFQRFGITPPRGVLFHGPPGTGKTLMARALAASCSTDGQKISFFMRKGADVLSKWVGEAERQLRLLFEEAKNSQPSIIFFDEIDGLAPVRSSKQDQIHASIVSTLLALMDGMDGRGQVIVIGATNRPDAVDPALRRPGRFDREFYFPLPDLEARRKILQINTKKWDPPIEESFLDELAELTKGYGGADLRALCTEAALNAVQRKYPQIYKRPERLVIKPEEIHVAARDFMISAKNLIPSTARSSSSIAAPLPSHLQPLLQDGLDTAIASLSRVLPEVRKINILEEAEYEPHTESTFESEREMQSFENLRVFRPRLLICGDDGMGQNFIGAALLHHLEGFHVQSLDFATLVGDPARTPEAAVVQIFNEAKRHKPSIIYIPALNTWANSVQESTKATVKTLLDSLHPSDPILLLALAESAASFIPTDVRSWFGYLKSNRVPLSLPTTEQREAFFHELLVLVSRKPTDYADAVRRRKRVLEDLPIAPPLPPRQPTAAELEQQAQNDSRLKEYLKFRLGPILQELKRRFKRFSKPIREGEEIEIVQETAEKNQGAASGAVEEPAAIHGSPVQENGTVEGASNTGGGHSSAVNGFSGDEMQIDENGESKPPIPLGQNGTLASESGLSAPLLNDTTEGHTPAGPLPASVTFRFHDIGLDKMHERIYADRYGTPDMFLADVQRIVENAYCDGDPDDVTKADQMLNHARILVDQTFEAHFRLECDRMAKRDKERAKAASDKNRAAADSLTAADVDPVSSTGKRARDIAEEDRPAKRARAEDGGDHQATREVGSTTDGDTAQRQPYSIVGAAATPLSSMAASENAQPHEVAQSLPRFVLSELLLGHLQRTLVSATTNISVDHLEQLRSACYDCIWRARKDWDKTMLIGEIHEMALEFVREVGQQLE